MIGPARQIAVYVYSEPCDMRKSFDTLAALATDVMKQDVLKGHLFLFVGKDRKRAKVLYFDGTGLCLLSKRLEKKRFAAIWQRARAGRATLTLTELSLFIEGSHLMAKRDVSPALLTRSDLSQFIQQNP